MKRHACLVTLLFGVLLMSNAASANENPVKCAVTLRGQQQEVYVYAATAMPGGQSVPVLFVPGDFGMHGVALDFAQAIAAWGYDVYGLDTKHYLESFTGRTTLTEADVAGDFRQLAQWIRERRNYSVPALLVGWSEGAGLTLLAAASEDNKNAFGGLALFGLTESNVLAWRWTDYFSYLTNQNPDEPSFRSADHLAHVAPLPLVLIHSSGDQYTSLHSARQMFSLAAEPKRFFEVQARNHRFDGNRDEFLRVLRTNLAWIQRLRA